MNHNTLLKDVERKMQDVMRSMNKSAIKTNIGQVVSSSDGIITVSGLDGARMNECLEFEDGRKAIVWKLNSADELIATFIGHASKVKAGEIVKSTGADLQVPVGPGLLGRVVDAIGNPIDGNGPLTDVEYVPCHGDAPDICSRYSVCEPYHTGNKGVDLLIPIGRGQRELIIGDRGTGKTTLALDSILHQAKIQSGVIGIYVAIGQRMSAVSRLVTTLKEHGAMSNSIVVVAAASDPAILQILAPSTGCAAGEYFMKSGQHAVIVYDDLSKHAVAYRQISLLLRRAPGREAYPGDTFYQHATLLERCAKLDAKYGGGSLTGLPIIETQAGDITGYIPTNVISITDGQIFLDDNEFKSGNRPAINFGLSVSRVGSAAQWGVTQDVAKGLKLQLAKFRELQSFTKSGEVDGLNAQILRDGKIVQELFLQDAGDTMPQELQCILFAAAKTGLFQDVKNIKTAASMFVNIAKVHGLELIKMIKEERKITEAGAILLKNIIAIFEHKMSLSEGS